MTVKLFFNTQQTKDISFRKDQLKKLSKAIKSYESDILEALYTDLGKIKSKLMLLKLA